MRTITLFGLVRRLLARSQNKRLLRRMMLERDKYADIRLSGAVIAERYSPTSTSSTNATSDSHAAAVWARGASQRYATEADDSQESATGVVTSQDSNNINAENRSSQASLSVSACMIVPSQHSAESLWIDKLRAQEEAYKQSLTGISGSEIERRRCESEDDAFEMWDYVCPQLLRPPPANEWV